MPVNYSRSFITLRADSGGYDYNGRSPMGRWCVIEARYELNPYDVCGSGLTLDEFDIVAVVSSVENGIEDFSEARIAEKRSVAAEPLPAAAADKTSCFTAD